MTDKLEFVEEFADEKSLNHNEGEKHKSPKNEIPACTVPYACEKPYNKEVADDFCLAVTAAAAKGEVDVLSEPAAESDVPPTPEFGHCDG